MYARAVLLSLWIVTGCGLPAPTAAPTSTACDATVPNGDTPPGEDPSPGYHGNGRLYTGLWLDGQLVADPRWVRADGSIAVKIPWWRAPGVGAAGDLVITGRERVTGATITAEIPDGYGQRFQATGIVFPTEGCFEISGESGDVRLTFVVRVSVAPEPSASRSPS